MPTIFTDKSEIYQDLGKSRKLRKTEEFPRGLAFG